MRPALERALGDVHYREGRFLLILGASIAALSLLGEWATLRSDRFAEIAALRLFLVVVPNLLALLVPRRLLWLQKILLALGLTGFGISIILSAQFMPPPSDALLTLGVVTLLGLSLPVLPFRRWELIAFVLFYGGAVGLFLAPSNSIADYGTTFVPVMALTALGATILARRIHWLERNNALLTLAAQTRADALAQKNARLSELSTTDPLTGLANRRCLEDSFAEEYAGEGAEASLLLLDIDRFKAFNDRWGHPAGDACLRAVAETMRGIANRHGGLAARYGGEEFVILLNSGSAGHALAVAEDLRVAIERVEIDHPSCEGLATCTASIGIAVHRAPAAPDLRTLLSEADEALYRAKAEGRNRCLLTA